jgi:hypothetical protein
MEPPTFGSRTDLTASAKARASPPKRRAKAEGLKPAADRY